MKIRAIIFGATGMVGEGVLHVALGHPAVEAVLVVGRRSCNVQHPKLVELIHPDLYDLSAIAEKLVGYNACFFCLGVSSVGMTETNYTRVTYDLTMHAAAVLARLNPGMTFCYVSGAGTDSTEKGSIMWARIKGRTENTLAKLPFKAAYAFRPAFIKPYKGQKHAHWFSTALGVFYPVLRILVPRYVCTLEEVGLAMIQVAKAGPANRVVENKDIAVLARANAAGVS